MTLAKSVRWPLLFVSIFWAIKLIEHSFRLDFYQLGIYPLSWQGVLGIFLSPFLHGNFKHLASNTPTFIVLGASIFYFYPRIAFKVVGILYLTTGIGVWLLARPNAYHIGASGIIYGFASFLFFSGLFRKDPKMLAISMLVLLFYGSMLHGIFPQKRGVSWESHLIGAVAGVNFAFYFRREKRKKLTVLPEENVQLPDSEGYRNIETKSYKYVYKKND